MALGHRLIASTGEDPDVLEQMGVSTPEVPKAVELMNEAIKLRPGHPKSYAHLGEIYDTYDTEPVQQEEYGPHAPMARSFTVIP